MSNRLSDATTGALARLLEIGSEPEPQPADDASGSDDSRGFPRVPGYRITGFIDQGGMGSVYRAVQLSTNRVVALKFLRGASFGSRLALARFEREVELLAQLNHPNIARLYDSGGRITRAGTTGKAAGYHRAAQRASGHAAPDFDDFADDAAAPSYYAMELVEGVHIDAHVREQALERRAALALFAKVCSAVEHAHQRGIIHRDLKPSNIRVSDDGEPHVLDFGLAKLLQDDRSVTVTGVGGSGEPGTLRYMSPEQAAGETEAVGTRSDVYSLGVILYELLTGQFPHSEEGTSFSLQRRIVESEPRRPRALSAAIDRDLEAVMLKAVAHQAADRYANAADLAEDIRRYLAGEPITARKMTPAYVLGKSVRRHRVAVTTAAAVLALMVGMAIYSYMSIRTERTRAVASAERAERALYFNQIARAQSAIENGQLREAVHVLDACNPERRHWEWFWLREQADQSMATLALPDEFLLDAAFVPADDGGDAGFVGVDVAGTLHRWADMGAAPASARAPFPESCQYATISGDGSTFAVVCERAIHVATTQRPDTFVRIERGASSSSAATVLSESGRFVALNDAELGTRVWSSESGELFVTEPRALDARKISVSDAGSLAWASEQDVFHRPSAGSAATRLGSHAHAVTAACFSPDGSLLLSADEAGGFKLWRLDDGALVGEGQVERPIHCAAIAHDGQHLALGGDNGLLSVWQTQPMRELGKLRGHDERVHLVRFSDEEPRLLSLGKDRTMRLWDLKLLRQRELQVNSTGAITKLLAAGSPLRVAAIQGFDGMALIWTPDREQLRTVGPRDGVLTAAALHPDGQKLACATSDGRLQVWDLESQQLLNEVQTAASAHARIRFCAEGRLLHWSQSTETAIDVRDSETLETLATLEGSVPLALCDGDRLLICRDADNARQLNIWRTDTWQMTQQSMIFGHEVVEVAGAADIGEAAVIVATGEAIMWSLRNHRLAERFQPYSKQQGYPVVVSPDGLRLLTCGLTANLWDTRSGQKVLDLRNHQSGTQGARFLAVSTNSRWLTIASQDQVSVQPLVTQQK